MSERRRPVASRPRSKPKITTDATFTDVSGREYLAREQGWLRNGAFVWKSLAHRERGRVLVGVGQGIAADAYWSCLGEPGIRVHILQIYGSGGARVLLLDAALTHDGRRVVGCEGIVDLGEIELPREK